MGAGTRVASGRSVAAWIGLGVSWSCLEATGGGREPASPSSESTAPGVLVGTWVAGAEVAVGGVAASVGQAVLVGTAAANWTVGCAAVVDASGEVDKASWRIRASAPGAMTANRTAMAANASAFVPKATSRGVVGRRKPRRAVASCCSMRCQTSRFSDIGARWDGALRKAKRSERNDTTCRLQSAHASTWLSRAVRRSGSTSPST